MTENLRLDNTANWDRDLSDDFDGLFVGLAAPEAPSKFGYVTSANSLYSNPGGTNAYTRMPRYNNQNTADRAINPTSSNANIYSYGNYYTFAASIADTTYFGTSSTTADSSICAKGWRLPTFGVNGNSGELNTFFRTVNGNLTTSSIGFRAFPSNGVFAGIIAYASRTLSGRGSNGRIVSNWVVNSISRGSTLYSSTTAEKYDNSNKNTGTAVRCILNNPETYTLAFNANGGSGKPANQTLSSDRGRGAITITDEIPTHSDSNLVFVGWSTDSNATEATYQPGDVFTAWKAGTTYTLYAIWQPFITVHFDGNGSTSGTMKDQAIPQGTSKALRTNTFAKTGYKFVGWGSSADATTLAYADKASYTAPASVTQGDTDTLYALWRVPYTIVYDGNNADAGTMAQTHSNVANLNRITLYASNFSRDGYGFIGWSFDPDAGSKVNTASQPTIYGPNETITVPDLSDTNYDSSTGKATLYAVWVPASTAYTMQTFNSADFSSESTGYILALRDERDDDVYAVAKLADGNFWMIENLRLGSDADWDPSLSQGFGGVFIGLAESETAFGGITTSNSLYTIDNTIEGDEEKMVISGDNLSYRFPRYAVNTTTYSYGNSYTWAAVIADTTNYSGSYSTITSTSICSSGWHVPAASEFSTLYAAGISERGFPVNRVASGYNNSIGVGSLYDLWTSTYYGDGTIAAYEGTSDALHLTYFVKNNAMPIRCIAD